MNPRPPASRGFTIVEVLIALIVSLIGLAAAYQIMTSQVRFYQLQREGREVRETLRTSLAVLAWQIGEASPDAGAFYAIGPSSITLRAVDGNGVVCSHGPGSGAGQRRYALYETSGYFSAEAGDSALSYAIEDKTWQALPVVAAWNDASGTGGGAGLPTCFWGDSTTAAPRPQAAVELQGSASELDDVKVGSVIKSYRRTEYGEYQEDGRWWLGRRIDGGAGWERLAGPLLPPGSGGMSMAYYDENGVATTDPEDVARVEIVLRAESPRKVARPGGPGAAAAVVDSLRTTVLLRNRDGG